MTPEARQADLLRKMRGDGLASDELYELSAVKQELAAKAPPDWERWHDLLDIRDRRGFTADEELEYHRFKNIVEKMDAEEAARVAPIIEALAQRHERVLASIRELTNAVRAKCEAT